MIKGLYTNRNSYEDFVNNAFSNKGLAKNGEYVYIAVAFFTYSGPLEELIKRGCHIRLIIRLGYPTNPDALWNLINNNSIEIRYFSGKSFHTKLYIFGDHEALVGSANLTRNALLGNQEVAVSITSEDERFDELALLFSGYWDESSILDKDVLKKYASLYNKEHFKIKQNINSFEESAKKEIGETNFSNIDRGKKPKSKGNIFLDTYTKSYNECLKAFQNIRKLYELSGQRKFDENEFPLRIEVDRFISFVRDNYAEGDKWQETPIGWGEKQQVLVKQLLEEWFKTDLSDYDNKIIW